MTWHDVGTVASVPLRGARVVRIAGRNIALFRSGTGKVYALRDRCPHRGGPLSQGIVHGERVTCPLHDWVIDLASGRATGVDVGCTATFAVRDVADRLQIELPEAVTAEAFDALDSQVDACAQSRTA
jgi:nitrite reductase (NADH) small subunit